MRQVLESDPLSLDFLYTWLAEAGLLEEMSHSDTLVSILLRIVH